MKIAVQKNSLRLDTKDYTLEDIQKEVDEDVKILIHLGYTDLASKTFSVAYGKRIKAYGTCQRKGMGINGMQYEIKINQEYLRVGTAADIHNTIMHECIHCIDGCMNHGVKWKTAAAKVNAHFDFTPIQRTGYDEAYQEVIKSHYHYEATCNNCGRTWHWIRRGKAYTCCKAGTAKCCCGSKNFTCKEY